MGAALEAVFVVTLYAKGGVHANAGMQFVVDRADVVAERNGGKRHHVAIVCARYGETGGQLSFGIADVCAGINKGQAAAHFGAVQAAHAGRVAIQGAGVGSGRGAACVGRTGAAGALFVQGQAIGHDLSRRRSNRGCQHGFV